MKRWRLQLALVGLCGCGMMGMLGCGGETSDPVESASSSGGPKSAAGAAADPKAAVPTTVDAGEPDQAVRAVLEGVRDGKASAIWAFLPSRYQRDINRLVQDFAGRVDAEVWNRTFVTLKRLLEVARSKKELLINNPGLALREIDQKQLDEHWPALLGLFDTLLTSELKEVKTLKTFDGKEFFAGTGTRFLEQLRSLSSTDASDPLGGLATSRISVIDRGPETARLQIGEAGTPETPSPPRQFIVIDGQWFPSELAADLDEALRLGRASVESMPRAGTAESRKSWLAVLDALDTAATALEKADTVESFNKALADAQLKVIPLLATSSSNEPRESSVVTTITVVLQGAMDEKARRDHIAVLRTLANSKDVPDVTSSNDATTVILTTAQSIQSIVDGIKFGKVTRIDERKRTITVRPGQRNKPGS